MLQINIWEESREDGHDQGLSNEGIGECPGSGSSTNGTIIPGSLSIGSIGSSRNLLVDQINTKWFCTENQVELVLIITISIIALVFIHSSIEKEQE